MKRFFVLISIIFIINGCTHFVPKKSINTNEGLSSSSQEIIIESTITHTENKELKKIMRKFDDLIFTRLNLEAQNGEEDMFFGKDIKASLKEFVSDTKKIESMYPQGDDEYIRLSKALNKQAVKLYKIVKIKKTEWVRPQVDNILSVCNECHSLYR